MLIDVQNYVLNTEQITHIEKLEGGACKVFFTSGLHVQLDGSWIVELRKALPAQQNRLNGPNTQDLTYVQVASAGAGAGRR